MVMKNWLKLQTDEALKIIRLVFLFNLIKLSFQYLLREVIS